MTRGTRQVNNEQITNIKDNSGCICSDHQNSKSPTVKCEKCSRKYHRSCLKLRKGEPLRQCARCFLYSMNPLSIPMSTLFLGVITGHSHEVIRFNANPKKIKERRFKVEMRSVRLDGEAKQRIYWPDNIEVTMDEGFCFMTYPLTELSSEKFRRDKSHIFQNIGRQNEIHIVMNKIALGGESDYRISKDNHLVGIFEVQNIDQQQLKQFVLNTNWKPKQTLQLLQQQMQHSPELIMEKSVVPMECPITSSCIKIPVRGRLCRHVRCFDLDGMLLSHLKISSWECPICRGNCHDMLLDQLLYNIIKKSEYRLKSIEFMGAEGRHRLIEKSDSEQSSVEIMKEPPTQKRLKQELFSEDERKSNTPERKVKKKLQPKPSQKPRQKAPRLSRLEPELISIQCSSSSKSEKAIAVDSLSQSSGEVIEVEIEEMSAQRPKKPLYVYYEPSVMSVSDNSVEETDIIEGFQQLKRQCQKQQAAVELARLKNHFTFGRFGVLRIPTLEERRYAINLYQRFCEEESDYAIDQLIQ